jgi:ornithine carbamoyltransferase
MDTRLKGRNFISLKDYSKEELERILDLAIDLKRKLYSGEPHNILAGKCLGMLFCSSSLRTRVAFETGITQLGGAAQYYAPDQLHLVKEGRLAESWEDTAKVLSRYIDGLMVRLFKISGYRSLEYGEAHAIVKTIANSAGIPVINGIDDMEHPTQVMADLMTLREKYGHDYHKKKVTISWVYDPKSIPPGIPHSLLAAGGKLGMNLTFVHPKGYELDPYYLDESRRMIEQTGGSIEILQNMDEAVQDADVIYAKGWKAVGKTTEEDSQMRASLKHWRIEKKHFDRAASGAIFMHAMPIEREVEVTSEVIDSPRSVIYDQAENRLHVVKSIMALTM